MLPRLSPAALTGLIDKDAPLALAALGGHSELYPQHLAGCRGVVDRGVHHLIDGVQQAGDVLNGREAGFSHRALKIETRGPGGCCRPEPLWLPQSRA